MKTISPTAEKDPVQTGLSSSQSVAPPVFDLGSLIGYVELGKETAGVLQLIHPLSGRIQFGFDFADRT